VHIKSSHITTTTTTTIMASSSSLTYALTGTLLQSRPWAWASGAFINKYGQ